MAPVTSVKPDSKLSSGLRNQQDKGDNSKPSSSPSKNLSHVPCKFFKQGACQAGDSCPFSHILSDVTEQAPCKYFQKGNCKFGNKCALAHILPDGRRVPTSLNNNNNNNNNANNNNNNNNNNTNGIRRRRESSSVPSDDSLYNQAVTRSLSNTPHHHSSASKPLASVGTPVIPRPSAIGEERSMSSSASSRYRPSSTAFMNMLGSSSINVKPNLIQKPPESSSSPQQARSLYSIFGGSPYTKTHLGSDGLFSLAASPPSSRSLSMSIWNDSSSVMPPRHNARNFLDGSAITDDEDDDLLVNDNEYTDNDVISHSNGIFSDVFAARDRQGNSRHASWSNLSSPRPFKLSSDHQIAPIGTPTMTSPATSSQAFSSATHGFSVSPPWTNPKFSSGSATPLTGNQSHHTSAIVDDETQFLMDEVYKK